MHPLWNIELLNDINRIRAQSEFSEPRDDLRSSAQKADLPEGNKDESLKLFMEYEDDFL